MLKNCDFSFVNELPSWRNGLTSRQSLTYRGRGFNYRALTFVVVSRWLASGLATSLNQKNAVIRVAQCVMRR